MPAPTASAGTRRGGRACGACCGRVGCGATGCGARRRADGGSMGAGGSGCGPVGSGWGELGPGASGAGADPWPRAPVWRRTAAATRAPTRRAADQASSSAPVARPATMTPTAIALSGQYAAKSERPASTPNAASNGWRRTKEGLVGGEGTSGRSRLSLAVMRNRLEARAGRRADQLHSPSTTPQRAPFDRSLPRRHAIVGPLVAIRRENCLAAQLGS
jgi:hypothetical protein